MSTVGTPSSARRASASPNSSTASTGRDGPVVDVTAHHQGVDALVAHHLDQELDERGLGVELGLPVEGPAEMPVAGVEEPHAPTLETGCDSHGDANAH